EHAGQALGEDATGAAGVVAVAAGGVEFETEGHAAAGRAGRRAHILAVNARGQPTTDGTASRGLDGRKYQHEAAALRRDGNETYEVGVEEKQRGTHAVMIRWLRPPPPAHQQKRARAKFLTIVLSTAGPAYHRSTTSCQRGYR